MTMKWLTKITKRESRPVTFGLQLKRRQVLRLVVLAILLSGPASARSRFSVVTKESFTPYALKENFVSVGKLTRTPMKRGGDGSQQ